MAEGQQLLASSVFLMPATCTACAEMLNQDASACAGHGLWVAVDSASAGTGT